MAIELTSANFDEIVMQARVPVVIDFWAPWCGPCRMLAPVVEALHNEYLGRAVVAKIDIDNYPELAEKFMIRNIPTMLFFKNGVEVDKQVGVASKEVLSDKISKLL